MGENNKINDSYRRSTSELSKYPFEIGSIMNYCSTCISKIKTGKFGHLDMESKTGQTWRVGNRQTTLE